MEIDEGRAAYVALALTPGIGAMRLAALLNRFETADGALSAPFALLCTVPRISPAAATAISTTTKAHGHRVLEAAAALGATVLLPGDAAFPDSLVHCPDPPTILFAHGDVALLTHPSVAVVGSRDHSGYGAEVCVEVAGAAARAGIGVVSGMARGLDAIAHGSALDAGGTTIGVLGNGIGVIYPAANRSLYQRVQEGGLLLTEFPPGERPGVGSFPRRNRLISALARVTVVIEAAEGSGTLITVGTALEQGRDVMAVPGMITSPTSVGTNRLIRDGAEPLLVPDDLLRHYGDVPGAAAALAENTRRGSALAAREGMGGSAQQELEIRQAPGGGRGAGRGGRGARSREPTGERPAVAQEPVPMPEDLTPVERRMGDLLMANGLGLDALVLQVGLPVPVVLAALSTLELRGLVGQEGGLIRWSLKGGGDVLN
jgi:DNA processing protein